MKGSIKLGIQLMKNDLELVDRRVKQYYWKDDFNCATTTLKILAELNGIDLRSQTIDAAVAMHGAGGAGAQCGLVEGTLMFLGIFGRSLNLSNKQICSCAKEFADGFQEEFGSLQCSVLRPQGFSPDNPPHLCEGLTCRAVTYSAEMVKKSISTVSGD
jgi:C_GCAxxG_C_C family probable redox protein